MDILVREVRLDDAEAITRVLNPIIEAGRYTVFDTPFTADAERRYILAFPERGVFHVAEDRRRRQVVGFQTMEPFATYTRAFDHVGVIATYVALPHRRKGIGRQLFAATFEAARRNGYEKIFTYVRGDNAGALAAYLAQGFEIAGTAREHAKFGVRYVDEIIIEKFL